MSCIDSINIGVYSLCCDTISVGALTPSTTYVFEVTDLSLGTKIYFTAMTDESGNALLEPADRESQFSPNRVYQIRAYTALCALNDPQTFTVDAETTTCLELEFVRLQSVD